MPVAVAPMKEPTIFAVQNFKVASLLYWSFVIGVLVCSGATSDLHESFLKGSENGWSCKRGAADVSTWLSSLSVQCKTSQTVAVIPMQKLTDSSSQTNAKAVELPKADNLMCKRRLQLSGWLLLPSHCKNEPLKDPSLSSLTEHQLVHVAATPKRILIRPLKYVVI